MKNSMITSRHAGDRTPDPYRVKVTARFSNPRADAGNTGQHRPSTPVAAPRAGQTTPSDHPQLPRCLAVLALLAAGCAAPVAAPAPPTATLASYVDRDPIHWTVLVSDEDLLSAVEEAAGDWEAHALCPTVFDVAYGETDRPDDVPPPFIVTVRWGTLPNGVSPDAVGWTGYDATMRESGRVILVPPAAPADWADLPRVVRHELGHAMGLDHDDKTPGVMMTSGVVREVSASDESAYARRHCQ